MVGSKEWVGWLAWAYNGLLKEGGIVLAVWNIAQNTGSGMEGVIAIWAFG